MADGERIVSFILVYTIMWSETAVYEWQTAFTVLPVWNDWNLFCTFSSNLRNSLHRQTSGQQQDVHRTHLPLLSKMFWCHFSFLILIWYLSIVHLTIQIPKPIPVCSTGLCVICYTAVFYPCMAVGYTSRLLFMALRGSTIPFLFLVNKRCVIGELTNTNSGILGGIRGMSVSEWP